MPNKYLLICIPLFLVMISHSVLANSPTPSIEAYAKNPSINHMSISPNGSIVSYQLNKEGRKFLVTQNIKTGEYLGGAGLGEMNLLRSYFIDENRVIVITSQFKSLVGYKPFNVSTAFIFNIETKEFRQLLIPGYGIHKGQTGLGSIIGLSPDKKTAYMPALYVAPKREDVADPIQALMKVSLDKKKKPKKFIGGTHDTKRFFVNAAGEIIARERFNKGDSEHLIESKINGNWKTVFSEITRWRYRGFVGLTPDRGSLVMTMTGRNGRVQYFTMSLQTGDISEPIFSRDDADVERVFTDVQQVVYGVRYSGFKPSYEFFDKKITEKLQATQKAMPNNAFTLVDHTPDWSKIILKVEGQGQSGDYYLLGKEGFSFIAASRNEFLPEHIFNVKEYQYTARDGLVIPTLITYPKKTNKPMPTVILPHGGPESYDRIHFDWISQYLASKGILVVQPQFRGSDGFGIKHLIKGRGQWGKKMQHDLTDAVLALSKEKLINPEKVCIIGASYGGYAALAGATLSPDIYQCAVSINGISDIEKLLDYERSHRGSNSEAYQYWQAVINKHDLDDEFFKSISPIHHVEKVKIPVLLIHAENDKVVEFKQSDDFYDEMEDQDKKITLIELENDDHYLRKNESRITTLKAIDQFVIKHLL